MYDIIENGSVSTPKGFASSGITAGIKASKSKDLGIIYSKPPCRCFGVFTKNQFPAAPILVSKQILQENNGAIHGLVVNSGNANACTGKQGYDTAWQIVRDVEKNLSLPQNSIVTCSTGIIGQQLDLSLVADAIPEACTSLADTDIHFAEAILTTDTVTKTCAVDVSIAGDRVKIGGASKGSGMIHPNMATMLGFVTTDIELPEWFHETYKEMIEKSFNSISVDGDMSTNDTCFLFSNNASLLKYEHLDQADQNDFREALQFVLNTLAKKIVEDGEGATKCVEIEVVNAVNQSVARNIGRFVANSKLVKTAIFGEDPNWGRVIAALGACEFQIIPERVAIEYAGVKVVSSGQPITYNLERIEKNVKEVSYTIEIDLGMGNESARVWTTDLSYEYVKINAEYTT
ncbi:MAG: bifunctional glutamate N-acetyltransferase/amino-acid acetyltransferase ArgJ [Fibrobacterales bacterium]